MGRGKKRRSRPQPTGSITGMATRSRPQSSGSVTGMATRSRSRAAGSATFPQSGMAVPPSGSRSTDARRPRRRGVSTSEEAVAADSIGAQPAVAEETAAVDSIDAQVAAVPRRLGASTSEEAVAADLIGAQTAVAEETAAVDSIDSQMVDEDSTDSAEKTTVGAFVPSSPIRKPRMVEYDSDGVELSEPARLRDPEQYAEYKEAQQIYYKKIVELRKLLTLEDNVYIKADPAQEKAEGTILKAAKFVLGLSSYIEGELLTSCCGILLMWDEGTGIILTTADLLCSSSPNLNDWLDGKEYAEKAQVLVQLVRKKGAEVKGEVKYLSKQYGFALISAQMDQPPEVAHARLSEKVEFGQDVILLGRDKMYLKTCDGKVLRRGADLYQRHHYMYYEASINFSFGGPVIDFEGAVIGMIANSLCFIPSSTIQRFLGLWKDFSVVPHIHLGMKLLGIKCLNLLSRERISWEYDVDAGLIVQEVSGESNAEKLGVRMGDIIKFVNRQCISTAVELENVMLDICKDLMDKGIGIQTNADVMVALVVFNPTTGHTGEIELTAKLSHKVEIIARGERLILPRQKKLVQAS